VNPLVTVICLCYNHERFIKEALDSVLRQYYGPVEIIIIDDASTDDSKSVILNYSASHPGIQLVFNEKNLGGCSSFNKGLKLAKGKYIIDFAVDDVMVPDRIEKQVRVFEQLDESYGVVFSNALNISENSAPIEKHFKENAFVPDGAIYADLLRRFFIPAVTMMVRRKVFDELGGYDETLSYEDFDFWVRSSHKYKYRYINEVLMLRRIVKGSLSGKFLQQGQDKMLESSFRVCEKAMWLNKTKEEERALVERLNIEMRLAYLMENFGLVKKYDYMLGVLKARSLHSSIINQLSAFQIRVHGLYQWYLQRSK
jgi:glycosyltransferase involved in cell wall biosynthesis